MRAVANRGGCTRSLLIGREIAVRSGDSGSVRAFLAGVARPQPGGADAWVEALKRAVAQPPVCR